MVAPDLEPSEGGSPTRNSDGHWSKGQNFYRMLSDWNFNGVKTEGLIIINFHGENYILVTNYLQMHSTICWGNVFWEENQIPCQTSPSLHQVSYLLNLKKKSFLILTETLINLHGHLKLWIIIFCTSLWFKLNFTLRPLLFLVCKHWR